MIRIKLVLISFMVLVMPLLSYGEDIDIAGGSIINVNPNLLIILDTSASMDGTSNRVPGALYNASTDYSAYTGVTTVFSRYTIYYLKNHGNQKRISDWLVYSTSAVTCSDAQTALDTDGKWYGYIQDSGTHVCGGITKRHLRTGNYLNYIQADISELKDKIIVGSAAVREIAKLMNGHVRIGLMKFNSSEGGRVIVPVADNNYTAINNVLNTDGDIDDPDSLTPLAESLAEAGLYFAGKQSWAHSNSTTVSNIMTNGLYTSPIHWRCQQNHVILITDGEPTSDTGTDGNGVPHFHLFDDDYYMNDKTIISYTDGVNNSSYLDEVATFLYNEDIKNTSAYDDSNSKTYNSEDFPKQFIVTHCISFAMDTDSDAVRAKALLKKTAKYGHGQYAEAGNYKDLLNSLETIIMSSGMATGEYVAPAAPVSKLNKLYSGNSVYLGLFKPEQSSLWSGNLKKYGLSSSGDLLKKSTTDTQNPQPSDKATDTNGYILSTATSCWSPSADGSYVRKGGAGISLKSQKNRRFFTYKPGNATLQLNAGDNSNKFSSNNTSLTYSVLDVASEERSDLIDFVRAEGIYLPTATGVSARSWVLGDIVHSRPTTLVDNNNTVIFVGANDGFMHCFMDNNQGTLNNLTDDTVSESWCFAPWDLLPKLKLTHPSYIGSEHTSFIDGVPILYNSGTDKYLTFGLRRGGNKYYTLDVGNISNGEYITGGFTDPYFAWEIGSTTESSLGETLGQSWCKPRVCRLKTGASSSVKALVFAGGYDTNQDENSPNVNDSKGRAIFAVNPATLASVPTGNAPEPVLLSAPKFTKNLNTSNNMDHSIVDIMVFDRNGDSYDDTIYAGDMGGKLFAAKADTTTGAWSNAQVLFESRSGDTASSQLKFFSAPDAVRETWGDYVYIGTGDRENPGNRVTEDRFYAIKNAWTAATVNETTEGFVDVTNYTKYSDGTHTSGWFRSTTSGCKGWFIRLGYGKNGHGTFTHIYPGEKIVSSPIIFDGVVYFSTFIPDDPTYTPTAGDSCSSPDIGFGRLYALNYLTGEAAYNFCQGNDDLINNTIVVDDRDRSLRVGKGMPSQPALVMTKEGPILLTGASGEVSKLKLRMDPNDKRYLWKQN